LAWADLLLHLHHVPVCEPLEAAVLVVVGKREVEVGRVELLVDLCVKGVAYLLVERHDNLLSCPTGRLGNAFHWRVYPSGRWNVSFLKLAPTDGGDAGA
jgi:hypothetical protein